MIRFGRMHYYLLHLRRVPLPLSYRSERAILPGSLVQTRLSSKIVHGLVLREVEKPEYECREIENVLIEKALSPLQIELCDWMSKWYYAPLGKCLELFLPSVLWKKAKEPKRIQGQIPNPDARHPKKVHHGSELTEEQQKVLSHLNGQNPVQKFLLHGITGSGKTEIYLQLIKKNVQEGRQTILLVPEIGLTTELIQHFAEHFPDQISIIHSRLSEGDRLKSWYRIREGSTKLILGSRSALFTPWKNLGAIILDEEHEWTYNNEQTPRYHARTVAEKIIELARPFPLLLLGSATPSIESYYRATSHNKTNAPYSLLSLTHRANFQALPKIHVVDLRQEYEKKNFTMFSDFLQEGIRKRLERKEQVILFLNKRGSSSSMTCRSCGFTPKCQHCDIALKVHEHLKDFRGGGLLCHYCGYFEPLPVVCRECRSSAIRYLGTGTEKAVSQLQLLFPGIRILRADKDSTSGKYDFEKLLSQMREGKADVLLGTQMISKGLDLPKVTLTGILLADIGLHIPDFRSSERVFQLLVQVAGRSGRHQPGEVILQTYQPDHPVFHFAKNHDYTGFFEHEIQIREHFGYPPFTKMLRIQVSDQGAKKAEEKAAQLAELLKKNRESRSLRSISVAPHYIPKLKNQYQWDITFRGQSLPAYDELLKINKLGSIDILS